MVVVEVVILVVDGALAIEEKEPIEGEAEPVDALEEGLLLLIELGEVRPVGDNEVEEVVGDRF